MSVEYRRGPENRYHLSCKALILNEKAEILMLHGEDIAMWNVQFEHFYSLLSETIEDNESPEQAVIRGAKEELNAEIEPLLFFGSREVPIDNFAGLDFLWNKTALYFVCKFISSAERDGDDLAHAAALEWMSLDSAAAGLQTTYDGHDEFKVDAEVVEQLSAYLQGPLGAVLRERLA